MNKLTVAFVLLVLIAGCTKKKGGENLSHEENVKMEQYVVSGQQLYLQHCSQCHQANGEGLGQVYPPLNNSDFMKDNFEATICLMKNGISGEIVVNGVTYNQMMPGVAQLSELELAEIATYIYNSWDNERGPVSIDEVKDTLKNCR